MGDTEVGNVSEYSMNDDEEVEVHQLSDLIIEVSGTDEDSMEQIGENIDEFEANVLSARKKVQKVDESWGGITSDPMKFTAPSTTPFKKRMHDLKNTRSTDYGNGDLKSKLI